MCYTHVCTCHHTQSSSPGGGVDLGKWYDELTKTPAIVGIVVVVVLVVILLVVLVVIVCYCKRRRQTRQYDIRSKSASSSSSPPSYMSSKETLDRPEIATPELSRKAKIAMEMKPLDIISDDDEIIPSGVIPVNMFREHVERFDENRQLLFQHEFDVSDVITTSYTVE